MGSSNVTTNISVNVGAGASVAFTPPANEAWKVTHIGSSNAFVTGVPDVEVSLTKGANSAIMFLDPTTDPGKRGRSLELFITHTVFLTVKNTGGAGAEISIVAEKVNPFNVVSDVVTIGAGATVEIDPGVGYGIRITEIGNSVWSAGPADINPNVTIGATDGTLSAPVIIDPTMVRGQDVPLNIFVSHDCRLTILDTAGGGCFFGYCAEKARGVISHIVDIANGGDYIHEPAVNEEQLVTNFGSEKWAGGGAPNDYPDIIVQILVGGEVSNLLESGAGASLDWNGKLEIKIDHLHCLNIHNSNGANSEVFISGRTTRTF